MWLDHIFHHIFRFVSMSILAGVLEEAGTTDPWVRPRFLVGSVLLIFCSFWLGPCCSSIVVFGWVRVAHPL